MKSLYLTLFVSCFMTQAFSQFTITSESHVPEYGDEFSYSFSSSMENTDIYHEGSDQSWDLSATPEQSVDFIYGNPDDEAEGANFPDANLVETIPQGNGQNYFEETSEGYSLVGQYIEGQGRLIFDDPRELLQFPFAYGDTYSGTFSAEVQNLTNGQVFDRSGTVELEVDGYGDLQIPSLSIENVVRVKAIYNYSDEFMGTPIFSYVDTVFMWYHENTSAIVGSYTSVSIEGTPQLQRISYMDPTDVKVAELFAQDDISIFPNPARDQITLRNVKGSGEPASIYSSTGQLVMKVKLEEEKAIDVSKLEPGIYFVVWHNGLTSKSERVVIQ